MGSVVQQTSRFIAILSMVLNILGGGASCGMGTILGSFSTLGLYEYMNVDYPGNVLQFFAYLFSGGGFSFPNLFVMVMDPPGEVIYKSCLVGGNNKFNFFVVSSLFMSNFGGQIAFYLALIAIILFTNFFISRLSKCTASQKLQNILRYTQKSISWNFLRGIFIMSFVSQCFYIFLQFRYSSEQSLKFVTFSKLGAGVMLIISLCFLFLTLYLPYRKKKKASSALETDLNNVSLTNRILRDTKRQVIVININEHNQEDDNKITKPESSSKFQRRLMVEYWDFLCCTRYLFFALFIATLAETPIVQCIMVFASNLMLFIIINFMRFFERRSVDIAMRISEGMHIVINLFFLVLAIEDSAARSTKDSSVISTMKSTKLYLGWGIIAGIIIVMVMDATYQMIELYHFGKKICASRSKKKKNLKVSPMTSLKRNLDISMRRDTDSLDKTQELKLSEVNASIVVQKLPSSAKLECFTPTTPATALSYNLTRFDTNFTSESSPSIKKSPTKYEHNPSLDLESDFTNTLKAIKTLNRISTKARGLDSTHSIRSSRRRRSSIFIEYNRHCIFPEVVESIKNE